MTCKALLRLFRAVEIGEDCPVINYNFFKLWEKDLLKTTIEYGFIFSPKVMDNYTQEELIYLIKEVRSEIGLTAEQINNSFHKSWQKIKEANIEQLVMEQIIHYITTYGFESLGIYDENSVYIPTEKLEILPVDVDKINLIVIQGYTKKKLAEKLFDLLKIGIALKEDTVNDIIEVIKQYNLKPVVEDIKNKEVKIALCDHLGLFPEDPIEFLRYVIFSITGRTILIKSKAAIEEIRNAEKGKNIIKLFKDYEKQYGLERLSSIFYRYKPIWLAMRN